MCARFTVLSETPTASAIAGCVSPEGQVLMTVGKPGMPGNAEGYFNGASSIVVAPNGDIFVGDGHGGNTNDRVVKFDKTGKRIATWSKHGKGQGEFDQLHGIAMDSQGRIFVADRGNSRVQNSIRTESSSLNGSSSAGRAMSPLTKTM
jgi:hypothetical protein